tara:strand:+ start:218 stop:640 length:423 start_codon:yes stop_codon:yes gene_type:complete
MYWAKLLKNEDIYYHATPFSNLSSIMAKGLVPTYNGLYSSESKELSVSWICMTNQDIKKIMVIPYKADPKTHRPASDHSLMMLRILGAPVDTKVYVTYEVVKPNQIILEDILTYDNPCYNPNVKEQMEKLRELQREKDKK